MAKAAIKKRLNAVIDAHMDANKTKFFQGLPGPTLMVVEHGTPHIASYKNATDLLLHPASIGKKGTQGPRQSRDNDPVLAKLAKYNQKDSVWKKLLLNMHKDIHNRGGVFGGGDLQGPVAPNVTIKPFDANATQNGIYFAHNRVMGKLTIYIYESDPNAGNATSKRFYDAYSAKLVGDWKKAMGKKSKTTLPDRVDSPSSDPKKGIRYDVPIEKRFKSKIVRAHDAGSTERVQQAQLWEGRDDKYQIDAFTGRTKDAALEDFEHAVSGQKVRLPINQIVTYHDLYRILKKSISIDWNQKALKKGKGFNIKSALKINIARNTMDLDVDKTGIKKVIRNDFINNKAFVAQVVKLTGLKTAGSKPLYNQIQDSMTHDVLSYYKRQQKAKITGNKGAKFKPSTKNISIKKGKKVRPKTQVKRLASSVTLGKAVKRSKGKGVEKGRGKAAKPSQAADLLRLKTYINKRLPAEVRKNMGRPQLINQTGRFSNSVQIVNLMDGPNTVMAKYTYLLNPYATFENTGKRSWPLAYNPKPLIAKSIRNLALGRIEQKLTTRRV